MFLWLPKLSHSHIIWSVHNCPSVESTIEEPTLQPFTIFNQESLMLILTLRCSSIQETLSPWSKISTMMSSHSSMLRLEEISLISNLVLIQLHHGTVGFWGAQEGKLVKEPSLKIKTSPWCGRQAQLLYQSQNPFSVTTIKQIVTKPNLFQLSTTSVPTLVTTLEDRTWPSRVMVLTLEKSKQSLMDNLALSPPSEDTSSTAQFKRESEYLT